MKFNWVYIKGFFLIAAVLFLYGFASVRNEKKKINKIQIDFVNGKNLFITYKTVNKLLIQKLGKVKNKTRDNIFLNTLEHTVLNNKLVQDANVYLSINGILGVLVKQKTPMARVLSKSGSYYIDNQGVRMPLSKNYSARVPLITSEKKEIDIKSISILLDFISKDDFLNKQIIGVHQTKNEEYVLRTRVGNQLVNLGSLKNYKRKFENLKVFYQEILKKDVSNLDNYKMINLEYNNQIVCTKK